jgi:hypothetical protein
MSVSLGVLPCDVVTASIELNPTALLSNTLRTSLERVNVNSVCVCVWKEWQSMSRMHLTWFGTEGIGRVVTRADTVTEGRREGL